MKIESEAKIESLRLQQQAELEHQREIDALEIQRQRELQAIEAKKFRDIVQAIKPETIAKIAQAGPEMQAKLLGGLGLQGYLVTDGKSPINLFQVSVYRYQYCCLLLRATTSRLFLLSLL